MRGRPFQPGNTIGRGRPKGSRNKTTKQMQEMLERYSEPIVGKCIRMALEGDRIAMRLCMERVFPARRDGVVQLPSLQSQSVAEIAKSTDQVLKSVARGKISPSEGESISKLLNDRLKAIEAADFETRIAELEAADPQKRGKQ